MTDEVGSSWAAERRRGGSKHKEKGSLRMRIRTINEKGSYVLHLDKSKEGRKGEMDRDRREKVIDELYG